MTVYVENQGIYSTPPQILELLSELNKLAEYNIDIQKQLYLYILVTYIRNKN